MQTNVYVDILLVINYIINMLLVLCVAKLAGRTPQRRRIVAAALFGSACSLTIFLPFYGVFVSVITKLFIAMIMVRICFSYIHWKNYLFELALFFGVNFFFAGVMLGIWLAFTPSGMVYYNGIVYFDISSVVLIVTTIAAYLILSLVSKLTRRGRLEADIYPVTVYFRDKAVALSGLLDTGNALCEPFSGTPVIVCGIGDVAPLLPGDALESLRSKAYLGEGAGKCAVPFRLIPYEHVGGGGAIPAFKADKLVIQKDNDRYRVESVYVGVMERPVGNGRYNALLNPELISIKLGNGGAKK